MLLVVALGLLLCWDASRSQGCSRNDSCGGVFLKHHSKGLSWKETLQHGLARNDKTKLFRPHNVISADGGPQSHKKDVSMFCFGENIPRYKSTWGQVELDRARTASRKVVVEEAVSFKDSVLLILNPLLLNLTDELRSYPIRELNCLFSGKLQTDAISFEGNYLHCKHPTSVSRKALTGSKVTFQLNKIAQISDAIYERVSFTKVVYDWVILENESDALLFVKGLARSKKSVAPEGLKCQFGDSITTEVVAFCQENVRCKLPPHNSYSKLVGKRVSLVLNNSAFPSAVKFYSCRSLSSIRSLSSYETYLTSQSYSQWESLESRKSFHLCVCTMVWNGAKFMREWVIYHSHLGVQRFFIYDNNSDDDIVSVIKSLASYNVSRHLWPWLKSQEASFSHCAVRATKECSWVAFIDLDEFIFPKRFLNLENGSTSEPPVHAMIKQYNREDLGVLGQLKISNFNFGPSGLKTLPKSGQMVNYVCRMTLPKRVKSIVRAIAIDVTYCSRVHHFDLKEGFTTALAARREAIIHHYKYQVWEDFKFKFVRRAATFVTDWQNKKNLDSYDRTPGLGTEAIEPPDWAHQFCEVEDTALRDYVLNASQLQFAGKLLWE